MRSRDARPGGRSGGVKRLVTAVLVLVLMLGLGFILFARSVAAVRPIEGAKADGIVVLTGGELRLKEAMRLLADGRGKRLLVSGAYRRTTREELRRVTGQPEQLFECCVDLGYSAHDTIGNAEETRRWSGHWQFKTLLVVTSGYHIPRAMAELRRELPDHTLIAHPVRPPTLQLDAWWSHPATLRTLAIEYVKFVPAQTRSWLVRLWRSVRQAPAEVKLSGWIAGLSHMARRPSPLPLVGRGWGWGEPQRLPMCVTLARGIGGVFDDRSAIPPSLALPHKGGGKLNAIALGWIGSSA